MPKECRNTPDNFCYICGQQTLSAQGCSLTPYFCRAHYLYFGCKVGDKGKTLAPQMSCNTCTTKLRLWANGKRQSMGFAVPVIWREPKIMLMTATSIFFRMSQRVLPKKKTQLDYPSLPSAIWPVPHSDELPIPTCPENFGEFFIYAKRCCNYNLTNNKLNFSTENTLRIWGCCLKCSSQRPRLAPWWLSFTSRW